MTRPAKPRPDFPLFPDANGQWAKKVKGRKYYFGSWTDDPKGERAVRDWLSRRDGIHAGLDNLRVSSTPGKMTVGQVVDAFLKEKSDALTANRISPETLRDYIEVLTRFKTTVGQDAVAAEMKPAHWSTYVKTLRAIHGPRSIRRITAYIRACFLYAAREGWIPAPTFGNAFTGSNVESERAAAIRAGEEVEYPLFTAEQIDKLLEKATPNFRAMILLGINAGLGPSDLARLRWRDFDFKERRLKTYRGKTGIRREAFLWKRTIAALDRLKTLKHTKKALEEQGQDALVFVTKKGRAFIRRDTKQVKGQHVSVRVLSSISTTFTRLAKRAGVWPGTFYTLRHTYRTIADNAGDTNAVLRTMGHALRGQDRVYVNGPFEIGRLRKVAKRVYRRLWPKAKKPVMRLVVDRVA